MRYDRRQRRLFDLVDAEGHAFRIIARMPLCECELCDYVLHDGRYCLVYDLLTVEPLTIVTLLEPVDEPFLAISRLRCKGALTISVLIARFQTPNLHRVCGRHRANPDPVINFHHRPPDQYGPQHVAVGCVTRSLNECVRTNATGWCHY